MQKLLTDNLRQGAWGISAGLDYKPGYFALTQEVAAVIRAAAAWRTNLPNHERLTPESGYSSLAGIAETIGIGEAVGVMPVITHIKVQGHEQGNATKAIGMLRDAASRGHQPAADVYPYVAGFTGDVASILLPGWALSGSPSDVLRRWQDPDVRHRLVAEIEQAIRARFSRPDNIEFTATRRKLNEHALEMKVSAGEALLRVLESGQKAATMTFGDDRDLVELLRYTDTAVACDCGALPPQMIPHPRFSGTFPKVLGEFVRERKVLTLEDAVRKMTGLPASIIGLVDRGFLAAGMAADITVFSPTTIRDRATYDQPSVPSEGIRHVLVNGRFALRNGTPTGSTGGRVLLRAPDMPTRVMGIHKTRSLSIAQKGIDAQLVQVLGERRMKGIFRLIPPDGGPQIRLTEPGMLQVNGTWASFTGRAEMGPGAEEQAVLVVVDNASPTTPGPMVRIQTEDGRDIRVLLKAESVGFDRTPKGQHRSR